MGIEHQVGVERTGEGISVLWAERGRADATNLRATGNFFEETD
jgi:hypothetical protein